MRIDIRDVVLAVLAVCKKSSTNLSFVAFNWYFLITVRSKFCLEERKRFEVGDVV